MASPVRIKVPALAASVGVFTLLGIGLAHAAPSSLDACLAGCKKSHLSQTNRATCRLDCETDAASDPDQIRARMARTTPTPPARTTPPASTPPASTPPTRTTPPPARSAATCKAGCDANRGLSVDDRASCKLDCEQEALPVPGDRLPLSGTATAPVVTPVPRPGPAHTQAEFLNKCHASCKSGPSAREATDFETCKLDCDTMASVLDVASHWVPDAWRTPVPATTPPPASAVLAARPPASTTPPVARPPVPSSTAATADACTAALERCNATCTQHEATCARACGRKHVIETDRETCKLGCGTDREVCQGDCLTASATCMNSRR